MVPALDFGVAQPSKPLLRGWLHTIAFFVAIASSAILLGTVSTGRGAAFIYSATLILLFGVSALYHRKNWLPRPREWMRRADHSAIFLLIAGTYTPISLALNAHTAKWLLVTAWFGALIGCLRALFWIRAPKVVVAASALILGFAALGFGPELYAALSPIALGLILGGGAAYSVGAIVYALRRPNPWPKTLGYHEIFHAFVVIGAFCHYAAVMLVLTRA